MKIYWIVSIDNRYILAGPYVTAEAAEDDLIDNIKEGKIVSQTIEVQDE